MVGCSYIERAGCVCRLTIHNVRITYLDLSRCAGLNLEAMRALNSLPAVTELRLIDNADWHVDSLQWLFNVAAPSTADPSPIPSRLTTLTTLDLTGCPQFATAASLSLLARQRALTTLRFVGAPLQTGAADALLDAVPVIETLDLRGCTGMSEQSVMQMLTALPRLVNVDITGCRGVTDRVLVRLVSAMTPSLRRVCVGGDAGSGKLTDYSIMKLRDLKVRLEVGGSRSRVLRCVRCWWWCRRPCFVLPADGSGGGGGSCPGCCRRVFG